MLSFLKVCLYVDSLEVEYTVFESFTRFYTVLGLPEFPGYHQWQQESQ